jgi:hypothetical protein
VERGSHLGRERMEKRASLGLSLFVFRVPFLPLLFILCFARWISLLRGVLCLCSGTTRSVDVSPYTVLVHHYQLSITILLFSLLMHVSTTRSIDVSQYTVLVMFVLSNLW